LGSKFELCRKGKALIRNRGLMPLIFAAVAWVVLGGVAHAQHASALVLEKSADVQPYTEIPIGKTISISYGARLVFQHYHTCRTVTVIGGKIHFGAEMYNHR